MRPQEASLLEERLIEVMEKGQIDLETVHIRKDKSAAQVQVRHSLVKTPHGQLIVSVTRDIDP